MRVTEETKARTRRKLLKSARRLFAGSGFEAATTRDISRACGIAAGTLFNYFPTKEALGLAILDEAATKAESEFADRIRGDESLAELLFANAAIGLRHMRPCRTYIMAIVEGTLSPLSCDRACPPAAAFRLRHMATVRRLLARRNPEGCGAPGLDPAELAEDSANERRPGSGSSPPLMSDGRASAEPSAVTLHLYWTLYLGVLAFWSGDDSENQQETLALLDQSTRLFVASLATQAERENGHEHAAE